MIRPIDTQILYPQSPELSNRQQSDAQRPAVQQDMFAQIMKDELAQKKDTIQQTEKDEKIDNNRQEKDKKNKGQAKKQTDKKDKAQKPKTTQNEGKDPYSESRIDIRI